VRKAIAADHNCDLAGDPGDGSGEVHFKCGEAIVEGRAARLGIGSQWKDQRKGGYENPCEKYAPSSAETIHPSHDWMLRFLEHRIADQRMLRLIRK
jgi:hypothetical protein